MWDLQTGFADEVAALCYRRYENLPNKGRPQRGREWTLMAAVVKVAQTGENGEVVDLDSVFGTDYEMEVVSMGTGSKCIGRSKMSGTGDIVNDSHAEVIARRGFLCFMYEQLTLCYRGLPSSALDPPSDQSGYRCQLKAGVTFHLFSSHTPCGDASIFPKDDDALSEDACEASIFPKDDDALSEDACEASMEEESHQLLSTADSRTAMRCVCHSKALGSYTDEGELTKPHKIIKLERITDLLDPESKKQDLQCNNCNHKAICDKSDFKKEICNPSNDKTSDDSQQADAHWTEESDGREWPLKQGLEQIYCNEVYAKRKHTEISQEKCECSTPQKSQVCNDNTSSSIVPVKQDTIDQNSKRYEDIHRTGAKSVPGGQQDLLVRGVDYHAVGVLRIKPGRGEQTISMSCSDKIARWNVIGCQGALLSQLIAKPVYFHTFFVGRCPFSQGAMHRAVVSRLSDTSQLPTDYQVFKPTFLQSSLLFADGKYVVKKLAETEKSHQFNIVPASTAVVWFKGDGQNHDVLINGKKQGFTVKNSHRPAARSLICPLNLFKRFTELLSHIELSQRPKVLRNTELRTHLDYKMSATDYQTSWNEVKKTFNTWISKPRELLMYSSTSDEIKHE